MTPSRAQRLSPCWDGTKNKVGFRGAKGDYARKLFFMGSLAYFAIFASGNAPWSFSIAAALRLPFFSSM